MVDSVERLAVVTGGSFGLGLSLCRHLIAANFVVLACGRSEDRLARAAAELPGLRTLSVDITQPSDRDRLLDAIGSAAEPIETTATSLIGRGCGESVRAARIVSI